MWGPDPDSPPSSWRGGLCERTGPSLYRESHRYEQEDFPKKKMTLGSTLGNSPAATAPVSSPHHTRPSGECAHRPGSLFTSSRRELRPKEPTGGVCPATMESAQPWELCTSTRENQHLILEGTETTGTRESANQGRLCSQTQQTRGSLL